MLIYILIAAIIFIVGYLVGANNPLASVKAKITADAQAAAKKLL